jgi:hypothetical protein
LKIQKIQKSTSPTLHPAPLLVSCKKRHFHWLILSGLTRSTPLDMARHHGLLLVNCNNIHSYWLIQSGFTRTTPLGMARQNWFKKSILISKFQVCGVLYLKLLLCVICPNSF